ncbi:MAG: transcription termination/antitermination NusG family protein [Pseudomonadota bacterium]
MLAKDSDDATTTTSASVMRTHSLGTSFAAHNSASCDCFPEASPFWYVAYTKPRQEAVAQAQLAQQNYRVYLPKLKTVKQPHDNHGVQFESLFPRYIFFQTSHAEQSIGPVRSTVGIANIVRFGDTPATMSHGSLLRIYRFEQHQHQSSAESLHPFQPGTRIRATSGPFMGLEGLVSRCSKDRVMVLMQLLGKETLVTFSAKDLNLYV